MSGYIGTIPTPQATQTRDVFTATASQTTFATSGYTVGFLDVYVNGVHFKNGTDYTATNGSDVVMASGLDADDYVEVVAFSTFSTSDTVSASGGGTFSGPLTVTTSGSGDALTVTSTDAGDTFAPDINFYRNSSSPADNDGTGLINFKGRNDNSQDVTYVQIQTASSDVSDGSENGAFSINTMVDGSLSNRLDISSTGKVGINEGSPSSALHVKDGAGANIAIQSTAGSHWRLGDAVGSSNGTFVLYDYTNSGVRLAVNSSGAINQPSQPAFQVTKSGHQYNIAVGTATVTFDTEVFDQGSNFSSNAFTAPVTGKYQLSLMLYLDNLDSAANYYQAWIATSNRGYYSIFDPDYGQDNGYMFINASILADMDANDTAYVGIEMGANGTAQTDINATTKFSGHLVA